MRPLAALLACALAAPSPAAAQAAARVPVLRVPVAPSVPVGGGALRAPSLTSSLQVAPSLVPSLGSALPRAAAVTPAVSAAIPASVSPVLHAAVPAALPQAAVAAQAAPVSAAEAVASRAPQTVQPLARMGRNVSWNAVFDGSNQRTQDSVVATDGSSRRSGLKAAGALALPAGLKFLAPALPYAAGVGVLVGTWFAVRGANGLIGRLTKWRGWAPETAVVARLGAEVALWAVGGTVALRTMGLDWNTVFASLGVGGLAVTLATKEFLGNFIRGVVLMADSPVRIGDRLLLDKRVGRVVDMTFRYIILEETPGEFTMITYSSLASAPFTLLPRDAAYAKPDERPAAPKKTLGKAFWIGSAVTAAAAVGLGFAVPAALPYLYAVAELGGAALLERLAGRLLVNRAKKKGWSPTGTAVARLGLTLAFWSVGLLTALRTAGVAWSALLAGAGVLGIAVGVAAGDILGNLVQAVWLLLARPFRVGDTVAIGPSEGKVVDMTLRYVVLESFVDGERRLIHVPYSTAGAGPLRVHAPYPPVRR
ncbi:mechanosensitive ion channel [bacterium]|nr:MAG: mechanosensitive ion channel [bacterium]